MSPRRQVFILSVLVASVLAIVWFLRSGERSVAADPELHSSASVSAEDVHLASPTIAGASGDRTHAAPLASPSKPSAETPTAPIDVVALFRELELPQGYWYSYRISFEFREIDLSPLRDLVRKHGLTADQLLDASEREGVAPELQPALILACAFCTDLRSADLDRLLAIAEVDPSQAYLQALSVRQGVPYAALRALWMLGAQDQLQRLAHSALPRYLDWVPMAAGAGRPMFVRDSAALALEGLAVAQDDELRRQIQRVLDAEPSMVMTPAAWSLYARSADRNEQFRILERGVALSGFARVGIESLADAACAPALHDVFRLAPQSVSGSYLRQSACVALFNIGTPAAWQSFELILEDAPLGSDAWIALSGETFDYPPKPQNLANVLECAARWTTVRPEALPALRSSIDRTKAALDRCTVPRRIVRQTCMELRSLAPKFGHDEESLRIALEVLAEHGDGEDQRFVRDWLWKLSEPARDAIESRLSIAR